MRRLLLLFFAVTATMLGLAGCGSGLGYVPYALPVFAGGTPAYALYHAYGDSITFGYTLADPATEAYPSLAAKAMGLVLSDRGIPVDMACDVATRQIFPAADMPAQGSHGLYSVLISTNDVDIKGRGPYEAVFNLCHQAAVAWLAVPVETKVLATSRAVTASGTVTMETANHWNALRTGAKGSSVSFPFTRAESGPVYVWYRLRDGSAGRWTYALDGVVLGEGTTATDPAIETQNGGTDSLALLRLPLVPAGAHTLTFAQTNAGAGGVGVVAIGWPPSAGQVGGPTVLVGTTPKQLDGSSAVCAVDEGACDAYIADITANAMLLAGDGLRVQMFDSRKYMRGTGVDMTDHVHPNAWGHTEIAHAFLDGMGVE